MNDAMPANGMCRSLDWARELLDETKPWVTIQDKESKSCIGLYQPLDLYQLYESVSAV